MKTQWEGVGVCSYLLVNFWFTRNAANQSSISAFLTNRVGDCLLTVGMFTVAWSMGNKKNIQFSKCGGSCPKNTRYTYSRQTLRCSNSQVKINFSLSPHLPGLSERDKFIDIHPYYKLNWQVRNSSLMPLSSKSLDTEMEKFFEWFVGFTDAEGLFFFTKQGNYYRFIFKIGLHSDDIATLQWIKDMLGFGKVVVEKFKAVCFYNVTKLEEIKLIINIFDRHPLKSTKLLNFLKFKEGYEIYINSNNKTDRDNRLE